ncbi:MAG: hypothetical protein D6828_03645, partial [Nitrospirae bacterium]
YIVLIDPSVEVLEDPIGSILEALNSKEVGVVGHRGMCTEDFKEFFDCQRPYVDAVQIYFMAFPRAIIKKTGLINEKFRFYRHLDLYFCFSVKDLGYKIRALPSLKLRYHEHRAWMELTEEERFKKSRHNFYIFYKKWHHHRELLT